MVQRLLFDRIDAEPARPPIGGEDDPAVPAGTYEAQTALALVQLAQARAQVALDSPVVERVPVLRCYDIVGSPHADPLEEV
jgi:hypothetical protein